MNSNEVFDINIDINYYGFQKSGVRMAANKTVGYWQIVECLCLGSNSDFWPLNSDYYLIAICVAGWTGRRYPPG